MVDQGPERATQAGNLQVHVSFWDCSLGTGHVSRTLLVPPGTTVDDVIGEVSCSLGRDLQRETAQPGKFLLLINGVYCAMPKILHRTVEEGDQLELVPPLSGG